MLHTMQNSEVSFDSMAAGKPSHYHVNPDKGIDIY